MSAKEISARQFRENQRDFLDKVCFQRAHYIVTRHGKKAAAVISPEDFQLLQRAIELIEDEVDLRDAEASYSDYLDTGKAKSLEKVAKDLGIDV